MILTSLKMHRRQFIALGAVGALGWRFARRVDARTRSQGEFKYRESRLGISNDNRDGTLYVPKSYRAGTGMPVVMWLHGLAGSGEGSRGLFPLAEELGFIVIAPNRAGSPGAKIPGFDADVRFLGPAYRHVANLLDLDPDHVALAGVSDGAGYALSMGLAYGNVFQHLMVFSGGLMIPFATKASRASSWRTASTTRRCRSI